MRKVDLGIQYLGYLFVVGKLSSVIRSDRMVTVHPSPIDSRM